MKGKNSILLISSVALILVLLLTGCNGASTPTPSATATPTATATATPAPTATPKPSPMGVELTYNCLNPQGSFVPVTISALAPRLDTIDGKLIYVNQGEADPVIMPALWERVQKDYPKTDWKYIAVSSFGPTAVEADVRAAADAVIRGIAW